MLLQILLLLVAGAIHSLGYPTKYFDAIPFASLIGMAYWLFQITKKTPEKSEQKLKLLFIKTLAFCVGHNICGYYWIGETLHVFGEMPRALSYLLSSFFSFLTLFHLWLITICVFFLKKYRIYSPLLFAIAATTIEWITPQQFPTFLGQNALTMAPYIGLAPIFGVHIFSFFSYWLSSFLLRIRNHSKKDVFFFVICLIVFISFNIVLKLNYTPQKYLNLRLVQASVDNKTKIESESFSPQATHRVLQKYSLLSKLKSSVFSKPDLIVWPETAYPYLLNFNKIKSEDGENAIITAPESIRSAAIQQSSYLLTGGYDQDMSNEQAKEFNSTFLFSRQAKAKQVYHKRKLIPFGETLPFGFLNKYLKPYIQNIAFFSQGERWTRFDLTANEENRSFSFITPICYEILSPGFLRDYLNHTQQTDFILNLTNDSWYGDTSEPFQHLFLSKWRAIEFQKPLVRSTNNGITSISYPDGTESKRLHYNEIKNLDIKLGIAKKQTTHYQKYGYWLQVLLSLTLLICSYILGIDCFCQNNKEKSKENKSS